MRKMLMLAAVAGLVLSSTALAQDSVLFFDIRDNVTTTNGQIINTPTYPYSVTYSWAGDPGPKAQNGGRAGDAQTAYITAHYSDNWETNTWCRSSWPNNDADLDTHTSALWLYMDVNNSGGGGTGVISSIGLDLNTTALGGANIRNTIGTFTYAWDSAVFTLSNMGKVAGSPVAGPPPSWSGARGVHVPVVAGSPNPVFDPNGGLVPGATPPTRYKVGKLSVVGGNRNCTYTTTQLYPNNHEGMSTYTVKMAVNSLLITRAFNGTPPDTVEDVALGYYGGVPESPYAAGNVSGATSTQPDAIITVLAKGDFNGDGRILSGEGATFTTARGHLTNASQREVYLFDYNGDRRILSGEGASWTQMRNHSAQGCGPF